MKEEITNEIWKDIPEYESLYQISSLGRVKSLQRKVKHMNGYITVSEKILNIKKNKSGYLYISLCKDGKPKDFRIHRLVAQAFIPNPLNLPQVNHINECKTDNRVENLEFCTSSYNNNFGTHNERAAKAKKGVFNTKKSKPVKCLETGVLYPNAYEVHRQLGLDQSHIWGCCNGKAKSCGGFHWKYA